MAQSISKLIFKKNYFQIKLKPKLEQKKVISLISQARSCKLNLKKLLRGLRAAKLTCFHRVIIKCEIGAAALKIKTECVLVR